MPAAPAAPPPVARPAAAPAPKPAALPSGPPKGAMVIPEDVIVPDESRRMADLAELNALANDEPAKPAAKPTVKPPDAVAKAPDAPVVPDPTDVPPVEGSKSPSAQFQTAKAVREWGEKLHKENETLKKEIEAAKTKKPDDGELKTTRERLEAIEKRKSELENELRFADYSKTEDYRVKYHQPIVDAIAYAHSEIGQLTVEDASGASRQATAADFDPLTNMPLAEAHALARERFGDLAPEAMAHRRNVIELNEKRKQALEHYRNQGAEREQQTTAHRQAAMKEAREAYESNNKDAAEKFPQYFGQIEGDEEANEALTKGFALADMAFKSDQSLSHIDRAKLQSEVRNRTAGFNRLSLMNKRKDEKIAALEKRLSEFEASEPKGGDSGREEAPHEETPAEELRRLAREG